MNIIKKNEYVAIKNQELTHAEKEKLWATTYSGSQFNTLINNPQQLYEFKKEGKQPIFTPQAQRAMQLGTIMEPVIIDQYCQRVQEQGNPDALTVMKDKRTFKSINNPQFTANIDGWIVDPRNGDKKGIFEAKCIKGDPIDRISANYRPQIQYYMWFLVFLLLF